MTFELKPGCQFCDKKGLPIWVALYAIASEAAGAPRVELIDADHKTPMPAPGGGLHYTRRLLRPGYLYVHDEKRDIWDGYFVTDGAYLMHFDPKAKQGVHPAYKTDVQPCIQTGHQEVAGMVTIPDPKNAGNVWFGFSDVEWTPAVLAAHADPAYRAKHMQKVDIQKALGKVKQDYVYPIHELGSKVAEFACDPVKATAAGAFYDSAIPFHPRHLQLEQTLRAADTLRQDAGIIVGLFDPVGVAAELANLMHVRKAAFDADPAYQWGRAVENNIHAIESIVRDCARQKMIRNVNNYADIQETGFAPYSAEAMMAGIQGDPVAAEQTRKSITLPDLKKAGDEAWRAYTNYVHRAGQPLRFDEQAWRKSKEDNDNKLKAFDAAKIAPLDRSHTQWMTSRHMANYFACNFDECDARSGLAYAAVFQKCIGHAIDRHACFNLLEAWLKGDLDNRDHLALRALVLNQQALAEQIKASINGGVDLRVLPNDAAFAAFTVAMKGLPPKAAVVLGSLIHQLSGVLIKLCRGVVGGSRRGLQAVAAMGGLAGRQIAVLEIAGSKKKFIEYYVRELAKLAGPKVSANQLRKAVSEQIRQLGYEGIPMEGSDQRRWLVALDRHVLRDIPAQSSGKAWANAAAKAIHSPEMLEEVHEQVWRSLSGNEMLAGRMIGILQVACISKLTADYYGALSADAEEAKRRLQTGLAMFAATLADASGRAVERAAEASLSNARGVRLLRILLRGGGKLLGTAAGIYWGVLDWRQGEAADNVHDSELAYFYYASAFSGGVLSIALLAADFVAVPLVVIVALATIFMAANYMIAGEVDNKMQEWLSRCKFNVDKGARYENMEIEQREFELSAKG